MKTSHQFPNDPTAVRSARQFALERMTGYPAALLEVVELLVSELATNSVLHTDSGFTLNLDGDARQIRISVTDHGPGQPELQDLDPQRLSGRGLALVEMFSSSWGVRPSRSSAHGKTVWLVLEVTEAEPWAGERARAGSHKTRARPVTGLGRARRRGPDGGPRAVLPRRRLRRSRHR